ncbi:MAG: DUF2141 domain-containing protein [Polyangiaceae bacterium]|nr:DUF2141 domain-containing protein [Polyangiaceae bacterium]
MGRAKPRAPTFALAIAALLLAVPASAEGTSVVTIAAGGLRNDDGQVVCALFDSGKGFPDGKHALKGDVVQVQSRGGVCRFTGVAPGTYAVALFHDENKDKVLNTFLGIPREGFGFSRNAPPSTFGPPKFSAAAFRVVKGDYTLRVSMRYL